MSNEEKPHEHHEHPAQHEHHEHKEHHEHHEHVIEYTVDDELQKTTEKILTPDKILEKAGIPIADHYLVQIEGQHQESYQGKPNEPIHMHPKMKFVSVSKVPTPVS
jgi:hypothetical protein